MNIDGILPVLKPKGYTSHDIVAIIRKTLKQKKVGHTGTLDPQVEGVLPICLGKATRIVEYIQDLPKRYQGSFVIGIATDTQDQCGKIINQTAVNAHLNKEKIAEIFNQFIGPIEQMPPMYSAIKVKGKRLYELARKGEIIDRPSRIVHIYQLTCLSVEITEENLYIVHFDVLCSKGTYIRTLCVDIGQALGYPSHMNSLIRIESGPFHIEDCFTLEEIKSLDDNELLSIITKLDEALGQFPAMIISDADEQDILNGCAIKMDDEFIHDSLFRIYTESGHFCALYYWDKLSGLGLPKKVFRDVDQ